MVSKIITVTAPNDPVQVIELLVPGQPGPPSNLAIGTINTLAEGQAAIATITGTAPNFTLNLSIPHGRGVKPGGATGDVLQKLSATDHDTGWVAIGTVAADPNTVVRRSETGGFAASYVQAYEIQINGPTSSATGDKAARKDYVDTQVTTRSKKHWFNVTDAPYNATGNGTSDDRAAIQAAIDAAAAAGGGVVFFPRGTYRIAATLTVYGATTLLGDNSRTAVLRLANGVNNSLLITPDDGQQRYGLSIQSLGFHGNAVNQTAGTFPLINIRAMNEVTLRDLYILEPRGAAVRFGQVTAGMHCTVPILDGLIIRGHTANSLAEGVFFDSGSSDAIVSNCDIGQFRAAAGISFSQHNGGVLNNVNVWQCRYGYQWYRSNRMRVVGCLSDYSRRHGFIIQESSDFQFDACQAREGSLETVNTYDGFRVEGSATIPCRDLSFMGVRAMGAQQRVGVGLINDIGRAMVVGGSLAGNAVAPSVEGTGVIEWRYLAVGGKADAQG